MPAQAAGSLPSGWETWIVFPTLGYGAGPHQVSCRQLRSRKKYNSFSLSLSQLPKQTNKWINKPSKHACPSYRAKMNQSWVFPKTTWSAFTLSPSIHFPSLLKYFSIRTLHQLATYINMKSYIRLYFHTWYLIKGFLLKKLKTMYSGAFQSSWKMHMMKNL